MKVLFADEISLYRYSVIEIAQAARDGIETIEASNIFEVVNKLHHQNISILIINVNIFGNVSADFFRSIPDIRSVLVVDSQSKKVNYEHILPFVYGVLDLDSEVEFSKNYMFDILNS